MTCDLTHFFPYSSYFSNMAGFAGWMPYRARFGWSKTLSSLYITDWFYQLLDSTSDSFIIRDMSSSGSWSPRTLDLFEISKSLAVIYCSSRRISLLVPWSTSSTSRSTDVRMMESLPADYFSPLSTFETSLLHLNFCTVFVSSASSGSYYWLLITSALSTFGLP